MAVDWLAIRNDYINGGGSYRKLAEKYGVPLRTIAQHAKDEKWKEAKETNCNNIATNLQQKTADAIVQSEVDRVTRLLAISDTLLTKIEQAVNELDIAQVTNKRKVKVIEYNNPERADKPTKEIIDETEEILEVRSIVDRKGLQQIATALKAVWDISLEDGSLNAGQEAEDDPLTKALTEEAERLNHADIE